MRKAKTIALTILLTICASALAQLPNIIVNNVTGSDTAASGAPSSFGPFSAAATCDTNGVATTVIDWPANPLAGVPLDGSAVLWMLTAAGRRFSVITARAAGTVTVEDSFNIPGGTPVDCAVGGKRATISTAGRFFIDAKNRWQYDIEFTGTDYTLTATLSNPSLGGGDKYMVRGTGASRPRIVQTANVSVVFPGELHFRNFILENTNGVKTASAFSGSGQGTIRDVEIFGFLGCISNAFTGLAYNINCRNNVGDGFNWATQTNALVIANRAANNTLGGFGNAQRSFFLYNLAVDNGVDGIGATSTLMHNTSFSNTQDGFDQAATPGAWMVGNLSVGNTGAGFRSTSSAPFPAVVVNNNGYFNNTGGNYITSPVGANDLASDPQFISPPGNLQTAAVAYLGAGFPLNTLAAGSQSTTFTNTEPGAAQRSGLGGGGNFAY